MQKCPENDGEQKADANTDCNGTLWQPILKPAHCNSPAACSRYIKRSQFSCHCEEQSDAAISIAVHSRMGIASLRQKRNPVRISRHFHRHGRACPGHRSWHSAATDGRDKPGHDGKAWFHPGRVGAQPAGVELAMTRLHAPQGSIEQRTHRTLVADPPHRLGHQRGDSDLPDVRRQSHRLGRQDRIGDHHRLDRRRRDARHCATRQHAMRDIRAGRARTRP